MFLNDLFLYGKRITKEAKTFTNLIYAFYISIGMEVDKSKSFRRFHMVPQIHKKMISKFLPFSLQYFDSPWATLVLFQA